MLLFEAEILGEEELHLLGAEIETAGSLKHMPDDVHVVHILDFHVDVDGPQVHTLGVVVYKFLKVGSRVVEVTLLVL